MDRICFKDKTPNEQRLLAFGFTKGEGLSTYCEHLADGQLEMTLRVTADGEVTAEILEAASGEEYLLHRVQGARGAFAHQVKAEYERLLERVSEQCFDNDVFKSDYAKRVIGQIRECYRDEPEYLWKKFPSNAIWRRQDNAKWYAALLIIPRGKLGLDGDDLIDILDLRVDALELASLVDGVHYFPGYHMNKKHWLTICLDGSVPIEEIHRRIAISYGLAAGKR